MTSSITYYVQRVLLDYGIVVARNGGLGTSLLHVMLRYIFAKHEIDCVLDVGANRGQYRDFLRNKVDYRGRIISFEPLGRNVEILRERARRDKAWTIVPHALGSSDREQDINVMEDDVFSSFHSPVRDKGQFRANVVVRQERVRVKRLDDVIDGLGHIPRSMRMFLKMDTQGHDLEVIRGAPRTLATIAGLQSEVSARGLYDETPDLCSSIQTLTSAGFDIAGFAPVLVANDRVIEFDCVMLNRRLGEAAEPA